MKLEVVQLLVKTVINMKIKEITDVVTNSSSEIFIIKNPGISKEKLIEILKDYHEKHISDNLDNGDEFDNRFGSGMGGIFEVKTFYDKYLEARNDYPKTKQHLFTPEMYAISQPYPEEVLKDALFLNIDENFSATCKYILDNFEIIEHDGGRHFLVFDEKGEKIVKVLNSWKEWREENLTRLQRYGKVVSENYDWD